MPLRSTSPFIALSDKFNPDINPYVQKLYQRDQNLLPILIGEDVKDWRGRWLAQCEQRLGRRFNRMVVEIGCHKGRTLMELAADFPDDLFIGFDITFKRVVMTAERVQNSKLDNVMVVYANAQQLDVLFAEDELDGLLVFFPDPWPKKKHLKNRLVSIHSAPKIEKVLKKGGYVWLKTDHDDYFAQASIALRNQDFHELPRDEIFSRDYLSSFERMFHNQGLATKQIVLQKR